MEEGSLKAKDLIRSSFTSKVVVLCSSSADLLIKQYNLTCTQLLQPFAKLTAEASWQDPSGQLISPKDLYLHFVDIASWKKSESDTQRNRRLLSNVVMQTLPPLTNNQDEVSRGECKTLILNGKSFEYTVRLPVKTPWFDAWRRSFLRIQSEVSASQHEFLNHFVACVLVITSSEVKTSEDIANVIGKLSKIQQQHQYDHPNTWILPSVLKYYLIVQDNSTNDAEGEQVYQNFRTMYGGNFCHLLKLNVENERTESEVLVPNPWKFFAEQETFLNDSIKIENVEGNGKVPMEELENIVQSDLLHPLSPECEHPPTIISQNGDISAIGAKDLVDYGTSLTIHDVRRIQVAVNEFISKAMLPHMERQCRNLHESILNRRGMSKSFFSATKRLFGTSNKSTPSIVYATESVEMLSRKLGDIYFLFGHYAGAYQLYHQLKKEFYGDAAWLYYSSALELAAISHFMMSQSEPPLAVARAFPVHYVNDSISHYIEQCRMVDAATRCAIICAECLKQLDNNAECAAIFIRMTSEDCDLRSALMLEQASYSFLELKSPRKYALHSVLAGYRYAKAGLKSHSLNSYRQAYQIYNRKGWRYAEDHVNFTIARLQNVLQMQEGITKHLTSTLVAPSPQPPQQIQTFYKEFLATMATLTSNGSSLHEFFLPQIQFSDMKIRIALVDLQTGECENSPLEENKGTSQTNWDSLEEGVVKERINNSVISFKPTRLLFSRALDNTVHPTVPCDEQFYIELPFYNPLKIPLSLRNITLKFDQAVKVSSVTMLELEPENSKMLRFSVVSQYVGMIVLEAVQYDLEFGGNRVSFQQSVTLKGLRMNTTSAERCGKLYSKDLRNKIVIVNQLPLLQATVEGLPRTFFHAQTAKFDILLQDKSNSKNLDMSVSSYIIAMENMNQNLHLQQAEDGNNILRSRASGKNFIHLECSNTGPSTKIPCVYHAPQSGEIAVLDMLILYEIVNKQDVSKKSHRVIKLSIQIPLSPAVHVEYSSLKMLDCVTYLGLLRLYNLTVDYSVTVNKICFSVSDVAVTEVCSSTRSLGSSKEEKTIKMNQNESRNIVLKFQDPQHTIKSHPKFSINVQWQIENIAEPLAKGNSQIEIYDAVTSIESSFIFQVKHPDNVLADFASSSLCFCDIQLEIHSRVNGNFSIQLENNPPKEDITTSSPSSRASGDAFFTGKTCWKLCLQPLQSETINYTIAVPWPGVYNAAPKVIVTDLDRSVQETYSLHSPIIVAQSVSYST